MTAQEPGCFHSLPPKPTNGETETAGGPLFWANKQWPHGKGVLTTLLPKGRKEVKVRQVSGALPASFQVCLKRRAVPGEEPQRRTGRGQPGTIQRDAMSASDSVIRGSGTPG